MNCKVATAASLPTFCVISEERSTHPVPPVAGVVTVGIAGEIIHGCYRSCVIGMWYLKILFGELK